MHPPVICATSMGPMNWNIECHRMNCYSHAQLALHHVSPNWACNFCLDFPTRLCPLILKPTEKPHHGPLHLISLSPTHPLTLSPCHPTSAVPNSRQRVLLSPNDRSHPR